MTGPVTALGIRDGDPAVLRALIARRGSVVLAYAERACAPAQVPSVAADAFARFRALVVAAPRPADLDPEAALLSSTRHAAAARAPRGQAPPAGAGLGRLLGGRPTADQITLVPDLLIARADGSLDAEGEEQLNRLLDASAAARAAEERFRAAEHAYRSAPPRPIPEDVVVQIVAAMVAVPADPPEAAPAPAFAGATAAGTSVGREAETAPFGAPEPDEVVATEAVAPTAPPPPAPPADEAAPEAAPDAPPPPAPPADEAAPEAAPDAPPPPAPPADEATPADAPPPAAPDPAEGEADDFAEEPELAGEDASERAASVAADPGQPTREWDLPPEEIGHGEALEAEIEVARMEDDRTGAVAAHLQTASGAVDEPLVAESLQDDSLTYAGEEPPVEEAPPPRPAAHADAPAPPQRPGLPGRGALAPAAAVVAVAAVSILATSGVFGGNESQPAVDTGVAPKATQVEVPEGEAAAVIEELRRAATDARRQRLADQRGRAPAAPPPEEAPEEETAPAAPPEDAAGDQEDTPAPDAPEGNADEETPQDAPADEPADGDQPQGDAAQDPAGGAPAGAAP